LRYLLHLAYNGSPYSGWQRQTNTECTVQQHLEDVIQKVTGEKLSVMGCGRTDAGVHAAQYIAHLDAQEELPEDFLGICNHLLDEQVALKDALIVDDNWHARYNAIERQYDYFLHTRKDPFLSAISAYYPLERLDFEKIQKGMNELIGKHDFGNLCRQPYKHNHTFCHIKNASVGVTDYGSRFHFQFTADRFLRGMIRIIIAKLIDVGMGKIDLETFMGYINKTHERQHKEMAYPQGLYLSGIKYPEFNFLVKSPGFLSLLDSFNKDQHQY